jgi:glycosyltransferase involved in cell wall biosynthesis
MKILIYTQNFLPDMGGLERNTFTLATYLTKIGHNVTVLTETLREDTVSYTFKTVRSRSRNTQLSCVSRADLIFINGGLSMKICAAAWLLRKKYVPIYQTTNLYQRDNTDGLLDKFRAYIASQATMSVTVSHHAKDVLNQLLPNHTVAALPNPIDAELENIAAQKSKTPLSKIHDLLFAGRLIDGKGIFQLVDALITLRPRLNLTVAFAGEGEHKTQLLDYAKERQLPITYLGRLDRDQLIEAYLQSKVLVVPSSTHTEGNPLVIAEALSLGVPVIASDQAAMVEAVGNAGYVFKRGFADDLAKKIDLLFENGHLEEKKSHTEARKQAFSYQTYTHTLDNILEKIAA